jgi:hypothetical protein
MNIICQKRITQVYLNIGRPKKTANTKMRDAWLPQCRPRRRCHMATSPRVRSSRVVGLEHGHCKLHDVKPSRYTKLPHLVREQKSPSKFWMCVNGSTFHVRSVAIVDYVKKKTEISWHTNLENDVGETTHPFKKNTRIGKELMGIRSSCWSYRKWYDLRCRCM